MAPLASIGGVGARTPTSNASLKGEAGRVGAPGPTLAASRTREPAEDPAMNAHVQAPAAPVKTTCPYCGVGCGVLATPDGQGGRGHRGRHRAPGQFRPALLEGLGPRRDALPRQPPAPSAGGRRPRQLGIGAGHRGGIPAPDRRGARAGFGRVLPLGPVAHGRITTSPTSSRRASSARRTSTPTRACACRARSPPTGVPSARTPCRAATRTSTRRTSSCWWARTPPGATRSCSAAWWMPAPSAAPSWW